MNELIEQAVNAVIRPPRREYEPDNLPLEMRAGGVEFSRLPMKIYNARNQVIIGSIYIEKSVDIMSGIPCAIYMHGNASSQLEGQFLVPNLCPHGVAVFLFDFAGCGASEGDYITLGKFEKEDIDYLMNFLVNSFNFSKFSVWGRSMGAATAIMARNPRLVSKVVDSAYTSIYDVCQAIAVDFGVPQFACPLVLWILKLNIQDIMDFDMNTVSVLKYAKMEGNCPMIMGHAVDDEFVPFKQGKELFDSYSNPNKFMIELENGHNGVRPMEYLTKCFTFILNHFGIEVPNYRANRFFGFEACDEHFKNFQDMVNSSQKAEA